MHPARRPRTPLRALTALATALGLMVAVTPGTAAAATRSHLSVTTAATTVLTHNKVSFSGSVAPRGNGVVALQRYVGGHWQQLTHNSVSRTGTYSLVVRASSVPGTTIYRVTRGAGHGDKALVSKTVHLHVTTKAFKVTAAARSAVAGGKPIVVTGSVSPKVGGHVALQALQHGAWRTLATGKLSTRSTYSISKVEPTGSYLLRVRSPYTTTTASGVSKSVKVVVTATTPAPTLAVNLSGTVVSSGVYAGTVVATAAATARAGVKSLTYSLDGAAAKPYTTGVSVAAAGNHTITVTLVDNTGREVTATRAWKITANVPDTNGPTVTVVLGGTHYTGSVYGGPVTVTINAADAGGVRSTTYSLDGGAAVAYTGPFPVSTLGQHSIGVTSTDNSGNVTTAPVTTWSQITPDTVKPTATILLNGAAPSGTSYVGAVTATATASDNAGGSGLASVTYSLDDGTQTPYTSAIVVPSSATGHHTLLVTATDAAGNVQTTTATWTQTTSTPDTTKPTVNISLVGNNGGTTTYAGQVVVQLSATDTGSGVDTMTYRLDTAAPVTVSSSSAAFSVATVGTHTVTLTATDLAGNTSATSSKTWNETAASSEPLLITSADQATLGLPTARLVFSTYRGATVAPAARVFTLTNTTAADIAVSGLTITGADASSFRFSTGQQTNFSVPAGGQATVSVEFHPTDPTGCPTTADPTAIGDVNRDANIVLNTNASGEATATADLSGINACFVGGNDEPVLAQVMAGLGYTDKVHTSTFDERYIGPSRYIANTDEIISPYFTSADGGPVTVTPLAHYGTANTNASGYQATGWYAQGALMDPTRSTCNSNCKTLWNFPPDFSSTSYNQNQLLLPTPTGTTSFTPTGPFGLFSGDFTDVNYSDDSLNVGHTTSNVDLPVPHYLHDLRVYPAYGPGHVAIPNTYIVGVDLSRVPAYKNNDYQDVVLLLSNAQPALAQGRTSDQSINLTSGVTVSGSCTGTFDGVIGTCDTSKIAATGSGLQLTSSGTGQLATDNQVNALYRTFDASRGAFTVTARVQGSTNQLQHDYQQIGAFFGPDSDHFIKVEAEHNGSPGLTLFWNDGHGTGTSAASASPAGLTTASTLDLVIKGNTNVPDPVPYGDTYGVHGYPLDELTVWYSIDGGPLTQIGSTIEMPQDVTGWFSRQAKAGILVASPGGGVPITATFSEFDITNG